MKPVAWSIVVAGAWNTAILTPQGVQKRLFGLEPGTPINLEIPIDRKSPFRIHHDNLTVIPEEGRLWIAADICDFSNLAKASEIAIKAMNDLPETPFYAAGVNIGYSGNVLPASILGALKCNLDIKLADDSFTVSSTLIRKTTTFPPGVINIEVQHNIEGLNACSLNFHFSSTNKDALCDWLRRQGDFKDKAEKLLFGVLGLLVNADEEKEA